MTFGRDQKNSYKQPRVIEPPLSQNANNARHSIWHFGREFDIEVYPTRQPYQVGNDDAVDDGRHNRGDARIVRVRGVIQPERSTNGSSGLVTERFGERTEGNIVMHLDSHEPFNIDAAQSNLDIFPNGIRIIGPDTEGVDDRFNFSTVVKFRGRRWKVLEVMEMFEGGDEDSYDEAAIYRAVCGVVRDRSHERNATPEVSENQDESFWGPYA